jgi:hypothetical protein
MTVLSWLAGSGNQASRPARLLANQATRPARQPAIQPIIDQATRPYSPNIPGIAYF